MKELDSPFTAEIDRVDRGAWFEIIRTFDDANIYQTWSYDAVRFGRGNISHLVLKDSGSIVAAAQARIVKVPVINAGIAYVRWGPLWRLRGKPPDVEVFRNAIRALRMEYVCRRGLELRILPLSFYDENETHLSVLEREGYAWMKNIKRQRTLFVNLGESLDDLRKGFNQKWRNSLNRAGKKGLEILEGDDDQLFGMFLKIYREMRDRKKYIEKTNVYDFRSIQKDLPRDLKMKILISRLDGELCAGAICSAIGNTGLYLFGATSDIGMKSQGSYLLQWRILEWLKTENYAWYNLNGIDPAANPGTYRFKAGLAGKNGGDRTYLGQFEAGQNPLSSFAVKSGEQLRLTYGEAKKFINKISFL